MTDSRAVPSVADALDLEALAQQLAKTDRRAKQLLQRGYLTEAEISDVLQVITQADRTARSVESLLAAQAVRERLRAAERDGLIASNSIRSEFGA